MNRVIIEPILKKTSYEIYKGREYNMYHLHIFGCKYFMLNNGKGNQEKFDVKADGGIFLGYYNTRKAFRDYFKGTMIIENFI